MSLQKDKNGLRYVATINLRKLEYSPLANPLLEPTEVTVKKRYVKTGTSEELVSTRTGEVRQTAAIYTVDERDDRLIREGLCCWCSRSLRSWAHRITCVSAGFAGVRTSPMRQGFAESIELAWFNDGLSGRSVDMSEKTFRGVSKSCWPSNFWPPALPPRSGLIRPCSSRATV